MKIINLLLLIALPLTFISCDTKDEDDNDNNIIISEKQQEIIESSNSFGFEIFKDLNSTENDERNMFISPLSMTMALGMTLNGAANDTKDAM
jgi:serine protease inhibitor